MSFSSKRARKSAVTRHGTHHTYLRTNYILNFPWFPKQCLISNSQTTDNNEDDHSFRLCNRILDGRTTRGYSTIPQTNDEKKAYVC